MVIYAPTTVRHLKLETTSPVKAAHLIYPEPLYHTELNPIEPATNYINDMDIDKNKGNSRISKSLKK